MTHGAGMALGGGLHVLAAVVDHFDGAAGLGSEQRGVQREDGGVIFFAAEAAAGGCLHGANASFIAVEGVLECVEDVVRALHAALDADGFGGGVHPGDHAVALDVDVLLRAGFVLAFDDDRRAGERCLGIAFVDSEMFEDVCHVSTLRLREGGGDAEIQSGVFAVDHDLNGCHGAADCLAVFARDEHDRFVHVADVGGGEHGLVALDEVDLVGSAGDCGNVAVVHDSEPGPVDAGVEFDLFDAAAGDEAADRHSPEHRPEA